MKEPKEISLEEAHITILFEIDGKVHLVAFNKDELETLDFMAKGMTKAVVPTERTQEELREFLGYKGSRPYPTIKEI